MKFSRQVYNIFDLLGDLGGVTEVIMLTFGFFLFSVSEHSFHMTAIKKLFYARTRDNEIFGAEKAKKIRFLNKNLIPAETPKVIKQEIAKHRYIEVKNIDWIRTYFARVIGCPTCLFRKRDKFLKLYEKGQDRIDSELDIVKIMRSLRNLKILMRHSFMDEEVKYQISHARKNLLNIDTSSDDETDAVDPDLHQEHHHDDLPKSCASVKDMNPVEIRKKLTGAIINKPQKKVRA